MLTSACLTVHNIDCKSTQPFKNVPVSKKKQSLGCTAKSQHTTMPQPTLGRLNPTEQQRTNNFAARDQHSCTRRCPWSTALRGSQRGLPPQEGEPRGGGPCQTPRFGFMEAEADVSVTVVQAARRRIHCDCFRISQRTLRDSSCRQGFWHAIKGTEHHVPALTGGSSPLRGDSPQALREELCSAAAESFPNST